MKNRLIILVITVMTLFACAPAQNTINQSFPIIEVMGIGDPYPMGLGVIISLLPTPQTTADKAYFVEVYEGNSLRSASSISWSQSQINSGMRKYIYFPISEAEDKAYFSRFISDIFNVRIREK